MPLLKRFLLALFIVCLQFFIFYALIYADFRVSGIWNTVPFDLQIFAKQAVTFWQSGQLYQRAENFYPAYLPGAAIYKFPPAYQLYIAPWLKNGIGDQFYHSAYLLAICMYVFMLVAGCFYFYRAVNSYLSRTDMLWFLLLYVPVVIVVAALYEPFYSSLGLMAAEIPIAFCLVMAMVLLARRPMFAGMMIALAATAKIYPAFMLAFFLGKNCFSVWKGFLISSIGILSLCLAVFGVSEIWVYASQLLPGLLREWPMGITENLNIVFFLFPDGITHQLTKDIFLVVRVAVLIFLFLICWSVKERNVFQHILLYGQFLITMIICLPNYWQQYLVLLLLPCFFALGAALILRSYVSILLVLLIMFSMLCGQNLFEYVFLSDFHGSAADLATLSERYGSFEEALPHISWVAWTVKQAAAVKPVAPYALLIVNAVLISRADNLLMARRQESL